MNKPNLDSVGMDELKAFIERHDGGVNPQFLDPWPASTSHVQKCVITNMLVRYARLTLEARVLRVNGLIASALEKERKAQQVYDSLPVYARW